MAVTPPRYQWRRAVASATSVRNWHRSRARTRVVAGASTGQSLHPSGCVQLCRRHLIMGPPRQQVLLDARRMISMVNDEPRSPRAEPATKPRLRRAAASRGAVVARPPEPEGPNVEIIEASPEAGRPMRWINIERPRPADRAWLEEHFDFHALDYEDVFSRNQRPKVDEYEDYLFVVLHFPRLRQGHRPAERRRARRLRRSGLRHHAAERAAAAARVPLRARAHARGAARHALRAGRRATCSTSSSTTASTRRSRCCARWATSSSTSRRRSSRDARGRSSATFPTSSRRSSTSASVVRPQR